MASIVNLNVVSSRFSYAPSIKDLTARRRAPSAASASRRATRVRAQGINPEIRKEEGKVVDNVVVSELSKPVTAYCRCWRSGTFPLCDGSHVKHNKATGDNVGPLLLKK
ncbi:hypothetical protein QJS04_geneDACA023702 [Acorus gramineus]|uniref:Iron-binding zinc finger CDGSH type domain-containing protein n=1 Tax=Acorus gramineus TaxID=55184 RepID=A0AAV9ABV3_ACOGR|nr:hypothetical protein QJS04_geneDACA023702 [Acorus gramineus]